jgi:thymidine phosphorylase
MVNICRKMDTDIVVTITDMNQPRGRAIGNALEIRECIAFLNGDAPEDLEIVTLSLAAQMIRLAGKAKTLNRAMQMAYEAVSSGQALRRFQEIIQAQGGDIRIMSRPEVLPTAGNIFSFRAKEAGYIVRADAKLLGTASNTLGAGRTRVDDKIDPAVGIYLHKKIGDRVAQGDVLCDIHWNDKERLKSALPQVESAFKLARKPVKPLPLIHSVLEG